MTLKVGIIGAGRRARTHLNALRDIADVTIAGIADVDEARAAETCNQYGGEPFASAEAMMDNVKPDVVLLVVPYFLHRDLAMPIIDRRLPFFIEKPLANNLTDATAIAEAVKRTGVLSCVGYQWRYLNSVDRARELIDDHAVGMVVARYAFGRPVTSWSAQGALSGGQILAQMTHHLDLARFLAGEVETVYAQRTVATHPQVGETGNWDNWSLTMRFRTGALGDFWSTYSLFPGQDTSVEVILAEQLLTIRSRELVVTENDSTRTYRSLDGTAVTRMHRAFLDAVRTGDTSGMRGNTVRDALYSGALSYAATASAESGAPVAIADLFTSTDLEATS